MKIATGKQIGPWEKLMSTRIFLIATTERFAKMSVKRWAIYRTMTPDAPMRRSEIARRVNRRTVNARRDIDGLIELGLLVESADGVVLPYDVFAVRLSHPPCS